MQVIVIEKKKRKDAAVSRSVIEELKAAVSDEGLKGRLCRDWS